MWLFELKFRLNFICSYRYSIRLPESTFVKLIAIHFPKNKSSITNFGFKKFVKVRSDVFDPILASKGCFF
ncbi:MAG: hypothetical protein ACI9U0_002173 [Flavobacteriales bacterium]|jgi:hypothetical protein